MAGLTVTEALRRAAAALSAGDPAQAERLCGAVLRLDAGNPDALNLLGAARLGAGRAAEAEALIGRALERRPDAASYWHNLAQARHALGRLDAAVDAYARAAAIAPGDAARHEALGSALRADKRLDAAADAFRRALALDPARAGTLTLLGDTLQEDGRLDEAVDCYRRAVAAGDAPAALWNSLGSALHKQGDHAGAEAAYLEALARDDRNTRYWINLGVARFARGDAGEALAAFEQCLARDPYDRRGVAYREMALAELGRLDRREAATELDRSLHRIALPVPPGFANMAGFNAALARDLLGHRSLRWNVAGTATTGGGDVLLLLQHPTPAVTALERMLRAAIDRFFAGLRRRPGHPFLDRVPAPGWDLDIWGTVLRTQGYQSAHLHPSGWLSGVYYVQLPESLGEGGSDVAGWIEFGRPSDNFRIGYEPVTRLLRPEEGVAFLFPSYVYHRTVPFPAGRERISIAFDVRPRTFRPAG